MACRVFEAYGLSENSSIISLNFRQPNGVSVRPASCSTASVWLVDGELLVRIAYVMRRLLQRRRHGLRSVRWLPAHRDIAELRDGYLYITGRKKHVIILSTARNISPEWVENVYKKLLVDDMIVMGEGKDEPCAIVLSGAGSDQVRREMERLEHRLADFARVRQIRVIEDIAQFREQFYTVTGRPRRAEIEARFIDQMYA